MFNLLPIRLNNIYEINAYWITCPDFFFFITMSCQRMSFITCIAITKSNKLVHHIKWERKTNMNMPLKGDGKKSTKE